MKKTFIIAEAGSNHGRNLKQAYRLIDVAKAAACDAVKFQTYSSSTLYAKETIHPKTKVNTSKLIEEIELPREWQKELKAYADSLKIEFMSTPFDEEAVDQLVALGVKRLKIAGFEALDPRIVRYAARTKLPLIISLGVGANLESIEQIIGWVLKENKHPQLTFLHCNNAYPTPFKDAHLAQITKLRALKSAVPFEVGFSDHTLGIFTAPLAVALGAKVIEKHYTLSRLLPGPDHPFAIEPDELIQMVKNIRLAEECLEEKVGLFSESETENGEIVGMRSLVTLRAIKKGELLTKDNVTTKRPHFDGAIPASRYEDLLGIETLVDLPKDHVITWKEVGMWA